MKPSDFFIYQLLWALAKDLITFQENTSNLPLKKVGKMVSL